MISTVIDAAFRSLLVALAVWIGLRAFRVRNVVAQKSSWGLVLAAAMLMPLLIPIASRWQILPAHAAVVLPADPQTLLEELQAKIRAGRSSVFKPSAVIAPVPNTNPPHIGDSAMPVTGDTSGQIAALPAALPAEPNSFTAPPKQYSPTQPQLHPVTISPATLAIWTYLLVASLLFARLMYGLAAALYLWHSAQPISSDIDSALAGKFALRSSSKVASPVTIGSAVVLPADYATWEAEKLRVVLAHEHSHVRQGDFYLQLLAGLYSALMWFSPLGWWLKNKLSDLAEIISDRAGLDEAASRSSYAQVLLQFAAAPRPTPIGVAMARTKNLSRRIERLLNDSAFHQAFTGGRRALAAVLLVPVALFVSTALIRVHAAVLPPQQSDAQPVPSAPSDASQSGVSHPDNSAIQTSTQDAATPNPAVAPQAPASSAAPAPPSDPAFALTPQRAPAPPVILSLQDPVPAVGPDQPPIVLAMPKVPLAPMAPIAPIVLNDTINAAILLAQSNAALAGDGYAFRYSPNGDSYALISGDKDENMNFSGEIHTGDIDKARKLAHGDFLWFKHNGKAYFVDDPAKIAEIEALYHSMEALGKQQEDLGKQQEELGKQQRDIAQQQQPVNVPTPDLSKEMADLNAAMAKVQAEIGKTVNAQVLAEVQAKLAEVQARLGAVDGKMYARMGEFGAQQGKLGMEQGKLGAEQGRLGAEQGRIAAEANMKVRSIIDQSLRDGKAHPVD